VDATPPTVSAKFRVLTGSDDTYRCACRFGNSCPPGCTQISGPWAYVAFNTLVSDEVSGVVSSAAELVSVNVAPGSDRTVPGCAVNQEILHEPVPANLPLDRDIVGFETGTTDLDGGLRMEVCYGSSRDYRITYRGNDRAGNLTDVVLRFVVF